MADNTQIASYTGGDLIATDDIGGVKYQRIKIVIGADGVNDGDVASGNPLPVGGAAASGATNAGKPVKQGLVYNLTKPTVADGQMVDAQGDANGNALVYHNAAQQGEDFDVDTQGVTQKPVISPDHTWVPFNAALDADYLVKASECQLRSVWGSSKNAAKLYLQIFNKITAPAGGDTAFAWKEIPAGSATVPGYNEITSADLGEDGVNLPLGCSIGISTVATTFTAATAADVNLGGWRL